MYRRHRYHVRAVLVLVLALAFTAPTGAVIAQASSSAYGYASASSHEATLARELFDKLNDERAARGLHRLSWDADLATMAFDWSQHMGETDTYEHRPASQRTHPDYSGIGENIYQLLPRYESVGYAHRGWMRSTGHRNNIVNPGYDAVGIGVYCAPDGRMWATQNLGRLKDSSSPPFDYDDTPQNPIVHDDEGGPRCQDASSTSSSSPASETTQGPTPPDGVMYRRLAGADRTATAIELSRSTFPGGSGAVVLVRSDEFADALSGAVLARAAGGPVLLTHSGSMPAAVRDEVARLDPDTVYVLGGSAAIADAVVQGLPGRVVRLAGPDRYATSAQVTAEALSLRSEGKRHAFLANGRTGWADAISVSGLAAAQGNPLLLAERDSLPRATRDALRDAGVRSVTLVGGTSVLSIRVELELLTLGVTVDRIAGATRYETAEQVREASIRAGMDPDITLVATLRDWPDSLVVGAAAAHRGAVVLAVAGGSNAATEPSETYRYAEERKDQVGEVVVVGGAVAVSDPVVSGIFDRMR